MLERWRDRENNWGYWLVLFAASIGLLAGLILLLSLLGLGLAWIVDILGELPGE